MKWHDIETACELLAIKPASLYSYVSRGLITARQKSDDPRASLYDGTDIDRLIARKKNGRKRAAIAEGAIGWGEPILESAITTVQSGKLVFRGRDAIGLSDNQTLEQVASLLWGEAGLPLASQCSDPISENDSKSAGLAFLANAVAIGIPCAGRSKLQVSSEASALLEGLSHAMANGAQGVGAHKKLGAMWGLNEQQCDIVRRALVLLADHELNPSTFAARIAASTGASLAAAALAGFSTLTGPYHGEAAARALDFLTHAQNIGPKRAVAAIYERSQTLPGLDHKLYPDGDPRAQALLKALNPHPLLYDAIGEAQDASGQLANIDMALAALTLQLGLPRSAPFTLFAVARMAGWLAHGMEQSSSGQPIRPRARYVGVN